jgi:hypothetical protein
MAWFLKRFLFCFRLTLDKYMVKKGKAIPVTGGGDP